MSRIATAIVVGVSILLFASILFSFTTPTSSSMEVMTRGSGRSGEVSSSSRQQQQQQRGDDWHHPRRESAFLAYHGDSKTRDTDPVDGGQHQPTQADQVHDDLRRNNNASTSHDYYYGGANDTTNTTTMMMPMMMMAVMEECDTPLAEIERVNKRPGGVRRPCRPCTSACEYPMYQPYPDRNLNAWRHRPRLSKSWSTGTPNLPDRVPRQIIISYADSRNVSRGILLAAMNRLCYARQYGYRYILYRERDLLNFFPRFRFRYANGTAYTHVKLAKYWGKNYLMRKTLADSRHVETSHDWVWWLDADTVITLTNVALEDIINRMMRQRVYVAKTRLRKLREQFDAQHEQKLLKKLWNVVSNNKNKNNSVSSSSSSSLASEATTEIMPRKNNFGVRNPYVLPHIIVSDNIQVAINNGVFAMRRTKWSSVFLRNWMRDYRENPSYFDNGPFQHALLRAQYEARNVKYHGECGWKELRKKHNNGTTSKAVVVSFSNFIQCYRESLNKVLVKGEVEAQLSRCVYINETNFNAAYWSNKTRKVHWDYGFLVQDDPHIGGDCRVNHGIANMWKPVAKWKYGVSFLAHLAGYKDPKLRSNYLSYFARNVSRDFRVRCF